MRQDPTKLKMKKKGTDIIKTSKKCNCLMLSMTKADQLLIHAYNSAIQQKKKKGPRKGKTDVVPPTIR